MRDEMGTTNHNWMDENSRTKNYQKIEPNLLSITCQNDFLKAEDYFNKDNIPILPQPGIYYGNYDYIPQILFDNIFANDKEHIPHFQEYPYDHAESAGAGEPEGSMGNIKLGQEMGYMGFLTSIMPPVENYQNLFVPHRYPVPYVHSNKKMVKQQEHYYFQKEEEQEPSGILSMQQSHYPYSSQPSECEGQNPGQRRVTRHRMTIGGISVEQRRAKIQLYLEKKKKRTYIKKIFYSCRKKVADQRIRVKGRFVTKQIASKMQDIEEEQEDQWEGAKERGSAEEPQGQVVKTE